MMRLLVVSPDTKWVEYLQIELEIFGIEVVSAPGLRSAKAREAFNSAKNVDPFRGVLISALVAPGQHLSDALLEAADVLAAFRNASQEATFLLWSNNPSERLSSIASNFPGAVILPNDSPETIRDALADAGPYETSGEARIELQIGPTHIRTEITLDGRPFIEPLSQDWSGRENLTRLEKWFVEWSPLTRDGEELRETDHWEATLRWAGQQISDEIGYGGKVVSDAVSSLLNIVGTHDRIPVRFNLMSPGATAPNPFVHVPFEMLFDSRRDTFLRSLSPVARRDCLNMQARTARVQSGGKRLTGPTLFVKSNAHGDHTFSKAEGEYYFPPLDALDLEYQALREAREGRNQEIPELLDLSVGGNSLTQLQARLNCDSVGGTSAQIIHYGGHSIRAGDGELYLILPGDAPKEVFTLRMSEFAAWARKAGAQLVILSSCESSVPEAVFRLSQAGIPAVIGFRWEINDTEAATFTGEIHRRLAQGVTLARAFHIAVGTVRERHPQSPTFVSPMLVIQNEEWTTF